MFPVIDKRATGINIRRLMDRDGLSVKDVQEYLGLASIQTVYHWLNGISIPTIDNLYGLSELFKMSMDDIICGSRTWKPVCKRSFSFEQKCRYYNALKGKKAA